MTGGPPASDVDLRLLFLCTANQCRSPMAEHLARQRADRMGLSAEITSGGVLDGGAPAAAGAVRMLAKRGIDLTTHVSHQVQDVDLEEPTLILTMERRHISAVAALSVAAVSRSFTLREIAGLAAIVGPRAPGQSVRDWVAAADAMRRPETVLTMGPGRDDIPDPMGGTNRAFRRCADEIDHLVEGLLDTLFTSRT